MTKSFRVAGLISFLIVLHCAQAFAAFDVSVHFNGGGDVVFIGEDNILEVYVTNTTPIEGWTAGLALTNSAGSFSLVTPYGSKPIAPKLPYVMEHGDAIDRFAGGSYLQANLDFVPNQILIGGANIGPAPGTPLPVHTTSTFCYSIKVRVPAGLTPTAGGFCVDNVFYPPAGTWTMVYSIGPGLQESVAPTFQGQPNSSQLDPDAPAVCFDLVQRPPCDQPEITNCPGAPLQTSLSLPASWNFDTVVPDDGSISWSIAALDPVVNTPTINAHGEFSYSFAPSENSMLKTFRVIAANDCGSPDTCDFDIMHIGVQPFVIRIEKTHNSLQGMYEVVDIIKESGSDLMGGYDFLIAYDAGALQFSSAQIGTDAGPAGCGWEYFTYRFGAQGNCGGSCPSGLLRIVAIADANNGANHPDCFSIPDGGYLASLKFYVTNDRTFECMYVPIRFAWIDCGDNGISSVGGDTLWISYKVFDFENTNPLIDPRYEITDTSCYFAISYGGACNACDVSSKYEPIRFILFWDGGIDIVCSDSIDAPGDLNLNDVAYEIADAVLYTNYFLYGYIALDANPQTRQAQIAASDTNQDGRTLSVGDLVYLLRVIVGDALPYSKLTPFGNTATVSYSDGVFSTDASVELGGVYATFRADTGCDIIASADMEVVSRSDAGLVRVLVYPGLDNVDKTLAAGHNDLFTIAGSAELVDVEVSDAAGNMLSTRIGKSVLPSEFRLAQNTPNPFNPVTTIGLELPVVSDWTLEIFNVSGQLVKSFNGRGVGTISVEWDASAQSSGVYFYKATAGAQTAARKMLLLK